MSTLGEHKRNGNLTETSRQLEDTKTQIHDILQHFDVLSTRFDRFIFKYISVYLIGLFFLAQLLDILFTFLLGNRSQLQLGGVLLGSGIVALPVIAIILALWRFNVWRWHTPKILRGLIEKKRIYVPDGDAYAFYLHLVEDYRDTLASPKRYFLSSFLMILVVIYNASSAGQILSVEHPHIAVTLAVVVGFTLSTLLFSVGGYCIGIVIWAMYISGWYIRKLVRVFELRIQPRHPDQCGGLKVLGNFCFGLVSPILISSGVFLGYILLLLIESSVDVVVALTGGFALLVLYTFPVAIFALVLPLRDIHAKMMSEGEADEDAYIVRIEALEEQIQNLLDTNQIEEAKAIQEKKALMETLHAPYPTWPFSFRSKIFSTVLGVSGSLLLGLMTAALEHYFLPAIVALLFQKP